MKRCRNGVMRGLLGVDEKVSAARRSAFHPACADPSAQVPTIVTTPTREPFALVDRRTKKGGLRPPHSTAQRFSSTKFIPLRHGWQF